MNRNPPLTPATISYAQVEDLTVASPATVSRVGIIYMEPRGLGLDALCQSWLATLPTALSQDITIQFCALFDTYLSPGTTEKDQTLKLRKFGRT